MRHIVIIFLITMLPFSGCSQKTDSSSSGALKLELSINQVSLNQGKVILKSTLINGFDQPVSYLPWNTPLDDAVNGRFLVITNSSTGKELAYQGRMIKRRAAIASDYVNLDSHDSAAKVLDLSKSYNFCANSRYIMKFYGELINLNHVALPVETQSIEFDTGSAFLSCL